MNLLNNLKQIIFNLTIDNFDSCVHQTIQVYDPNFPYSFNFIICNLIYNAFFTQNNLFDIYLKYLEAIQTKEEEINKTHPEIVDIFISYISEIQTHEAYYLIAKMIEKNLIDINITNPPRFKHFAYYKNNVKTDIRYKINGLSKNYQSEETFMKNYEKHVKNVWELHKKYIKEGHNPNEISKIIRNDEIEKLQEISSQNDFDFNQTIKPSLYERCDFINQKNVTLIDYAAFFGSVKCFKYLLMNGANINNTGKHAVAGGNEEIIHL